MAYILETRRNATLSGKAISPLLPLIRYRYPSRLEVICIWSIRYESDYLCSPTLIKIVMSCQRCYSRKVKCDRKLPSCSSCQEANVPCKSAVNTRNTPSLKKGNRILREEGQLKRKIEVYERYMRRKGSDPCLVFQPEQDTFTSESCSSSSAYESELGTPPTPTTDLPRCHTANKDPADVTTVAGLHHLPDTTILEGLNPQTYTHRTRVIFS